MTQTTRMYLFLDDTYYGTGDDSYICELITDYITQYKKPVKFEIIDHDTFKTRMKDTTN